MSTLYILCIPLAPAQKTNFTFEKETHFFSFRGELGLLAHTKSEPIHYSFSKAVKPLNETEADRLREIIHHHSEMGIMREETKGLSHPDTLHSFLTVAEAYFHLGQYAKAQPLLEQVFILSDETSRPEFTVQAAEILNFIYRSTDFRSNLRALNKKSLSPPSRRRK